MGWLRAPIPGSIRWSHFFWSKISLHGLHWFTQVYIRLPPDEVICASTPSDAQGNGHALNHRVTPGASVPSDAQGNGHALYLRATICASIPSDTQGNGHALSPRATISLSICASTREWTRSKSSGNKHSKLDNKMEEQKMANRSAKRKNDYMVF